MAIKFPSTSYPKTFLIHLRLPKSCYINNNKNLFFQFSVAITKKFYPKPVEVKKMPKIGKMEMTMVNFSSKL